MKKSIKFALEVTLFVVAAYGISSCGNNVQNDPKAPKDAAAAREFAASKVWSETPDTVFLGYHWGMSKKDVEAQTKAYVKEKKFKRDMFGAIRYDMTLDKVGDVVTNVRFGYYNDSLNTVALVVDYLNTPNHVSITEFYEGFSDMFIEKGYTFFYEEFNPIIKTPTYDFFKGNTSITFVDSQGVTCMIFCNEYMAALNRKETAAREEAALQEKIKSIEEKSRKTKSDF